MNKVFNEEWIQSCTTDLPDGVDVVTIKDSSIRMKVELAAVTSSIMFKIPMATARKLAWKSAIKRGDAKAVSGLPKKEDSND